MSSTDDERRVQRFFDERIAPAAARLRARGVAFFPLGPEPGAASWYSGPPEGPDFQPLQPADLAAALRAQWSDVPELEALADPLVLLARSLEVQDEDDGEISPFVYVMY
jgi:hypothetical protein